MQNAFNQFAEQMQIRRQITAQRDSARSGEQQVDEEDSDTEEEEEMSDEELSEQELSEGDVEEETNDAEVKNIKFAISLSESDNDENNKVIKTKPKRRRNEVKKIDAPDPEQA